MREEPDALTHPIDDALGRCDVSVVLPTLNERDNIEQIVPALRRTLASLGVIGEIVVVDGGSDDGTAEAAERCGARAIRVGRGYGNAIRVGLQGAKGDYVITLDADFSHDPEVIEHLWAARDPSALVVASRYVAGGSMATSRLREVLSRILNVVFARSLLLPVHDLSSGFRIYPTASSRSLEVRATDFDFLIEFLVRAYLAGWHIAEVPFHYAPRLSGTSKARILRLGRAYALTFARMWYLRRSTPPTAWRSTAASAAPASEAPGS